MSSEAQPPEMEALATNSKPETKMGRKLKNTRPCHPPYFKMIKEAIVGLNEKGGSSPYAIAKYMEQKHKALLPSNFRKIVGFQLKKSVSKGNLIKIKASYKLSQALKKTKAARANAAKSKPPTTSTTATTTTTTKRWRRKPKSRAVSKIDNPPKSTPTSNSTPTLTVRRSKRSPKPKLLKSIKSLKPNKA
ncbi:histone H1-like [Chenopodium quinoa]|uniref:histone H1-like n=1 Tax=Chenopodium quinoa TaxID=63459 RepID=UPI000B7901CA|nr:histone H1-like [Chenopodium quinoa]